jgi:hypothetical protein
METRLREIYTAVQEIGGPVKGDLAGALHEAAAASPASFARFLATVPLNRDCMLFEIYEVLLQEPARHATVLLDELKRMLVQANEEPRNPALYRQLDAFALIKDPQLRRCAAAVLCDALRSPRAQVRRFAAELAGDIADNPSELQALLRGAVALDPDWRVRLLAYESLRDLSAETPLRSGAMHEETLSLRPGGGPSIVYCLILRSFSIALI